MVKHYYPSRKSLKTIDSSQLFQKIFGHKAFQEWFKKISGHGVVPVIIGAAVTVTGYSEMHVRSVALTLCALWFAIDVGIWLAETKSNYKEALFAASAGSLFSSAMAIMYWFLYSTLKDEQTDVYANLTAQVGNAPAGDVMQTFFTVTNNSRESLTETSSCITKLIVADNGYHLHPRSHRIDVPEWSYTQGQRGFQLNSAPNTLGRLFVDR